MGRRLGDKNSRPRSDIGKPQALKPRGKINYPKTRKSTPRPRLIGHPRLCQAKFKKDPNRKCKRWALVGSHFCEFHGGRKGGKTRILNRNTRMPRFYTKYLSRTLAEAIEEQLSTPQSEQLQMYEELAVLRQTTVDVMKLWDAAVLSGDDDAITKANQLVRLYMSENIRLGSIVATIEANNKDKFSVYSLVAVVDQITRVAYKVFGDDIEKAKQFEEMVKQQVKLPSKETGTLSTPDQDVANMDDSVPK